jgi:PAS domain S-box-containing protein
MIAPADRQRAEEALSDMLSGTQQVRQGGEYLAQKKDGSTFPFSIYSSPVIRDGRITGHRGIIIDITASRKAEEALSESEEKYRLVVENSHDAIYIHRNDRLLFANQRASEFSGYTADELLTMNLWDLVHPDDRARLQDAARRRFTGEGVPGYFTARIIQKSGEVRDGGFFVDLVTYQGTPAIIGIVRDITEQERADATIRESEERYRRSDQFLREVINGAGEGIIVYDRDLRITLWSRFMEEMTGIPAADIMGKKAPEIYSFLVDAGVDSLLRQALAGATVTSPDIRFRIPSSGREGWSQGMYSPHYGANGEIIGVIGIIRDITRQKQAEEARQQSEVRFRSLIQNASDMIDILDREGQIVYESPSAEKIMGCSAGANTGTAAMTLVHPDDRERVRADLLQVYDQTNPGTPTEFRLKKADGTFTWVESVATNLLDMPAVDGIVVTTRPIVQRKELETALRESEVRYRNVVEDQTEFICRFLPDGTHVFVNGAYCRYFGLDRERILGTQFKPAIPPDDARKLGEFFASLTPAHPVDFIEHRTIMPDGTIRWQRWSDRAIFDAFGKLIEYQSVGRDTTDTKTVQDALRERETLYRSLSEASNDLIYVIDRAGRVTYLNSSAAAMFGRPAGELIGREWKSFFPENVAENQGAVLRRVFESGKQMRSRSELPLGGQPFWLDHSLVPIRDAAGTVTEVLGVSRDISDLLRAEDDIREANKKMNLLTRITRHDVANQVSILKGYIRMALMRRPDPVVAEFLGKIDAAGTAINRQIEFTKMYQELGLRSPAWSAVRDLVARQRAAGFAVSCTCDAEVLADPLIERVFFNLCDNAVRHGERVTAITVRCGPGPDGLVILVEDNGTGVPPDLKTKIFKKGFGRNTGYGLFLAREILAITGITICETGVPGTGARFELHVPEGKYRLAGNG